MMLSLIKQTLSVCCFMIAGLAVLAVTLVLAPFAVVFLLGIALRNGTATTEQDTADPGYTGPGSVAHGMLLRYPAGATSNAVEWNTNDTKCSKNTVN